MPILYRKTVKGVAEIETRTHRLPPRLRQMLILVDGRRTDLALRQLISPGSDEALHALAADGFIELVGVTAAPGVATPAPVPGAATVAQAPAPAAPAAAPAGASAFTEQDRRDAVRMLTDLVGPTGEALALKIERARSDDELRPLFAMAHQSIRNTRGSFAATAFADRFLARSAG